MHLKQLLSLILLSSTTLVLSQQREVLLGKADSLYKAKAYEQAGEYYQKSAALGWMKPLKKNAFYNAACSFSLVKNKALAFKNLELSIKNGYKNKEGLIADTDLDYLKADKRWKKILRSITKSNSENPLKAKLVTSDITNFYNAFELALKDSANAKTIFRERYFLKGSDGLQDFFTTKITNEDLFVKTIFLYKNFYTSAKATLLQTKSLSDSIYANSARFKKWYPKAVFPDVYFVVGRFNSNGTISDNGLLIGTEQMSKTPQTNTTDWKDWQHKWIMNFKQIPVTVSHELVHFNQDGMKRENTLLCYAAIEGSAEFIAERITGKTDGDYSAYKGREQKIWQDFKTDMYLDKYGEWISEQPNRPRNGMYWAGYLMCKSYYDRATNKQQAIDDILHIQDYKAFFEKSQIDDYILQFKNETH